METAPRVVAMVLLATGMAGVIAWTAILFTGMHFLSEVVGSPPAVMAFSVPLPVPPVLSPVRSDLSTDYYEMSVQPGTARILPGVATRMITYNGWVSIRSTATSLTTPPWP